MRSTFAPWILFFVAGVLVGCGDSGDSVSSDLTGNQGLDSVVVAEDILPEQSPTDIDSVDAVTQDVALHDVVALDGEIVPQADASGVDMMVVDTPGADVGEAGPITLPGGLIGTPVPVPSLPPEFVSVVDSDGNEVNASDLLGSPTIMWFFPLPSTPG